MVEERARQAGAVAQPVLGQEAPGIARRRSEIDGAAAARAATEADSSIRPQSPAAAAKLRRRAGRPVEAVQIGRSASGRSISHCSMAVRRRCCQIGRARSTIRTSWPPAPRPRATR
jgi:hypothetical protein